MALSSSPHRAAIDLLFGLPNSFIEEWPGILLFLMHVEHNLSSAIHPQDGIVRRLLDDWHSDPRQIAWKWCFAVIHAIETFRSDQVSIDNVYQKLVSDSGCSSTSFSPQDMDAVYRTIFAILCWTSMCFEPVLVSTPSPTSTAASNVLSPWVKGPHQSLSWRDFKRPIVKIFKMFSKRLPAESSQGNEPSIVPSVISIDPGSTTETVYESIVNYYTLQKIGHVRLEWVDTITDHLRFDPYTRTLSLFRLPTFCLAVVVSQKSAEVIRRCVDDVQKDLERL